MWMYQLKIIKLAFWFSRSAGTYFYKFAKKAVLCSGCEDASHRDSCSNCRRGRKSSVQPQVDSLFKCVGGKYGVLWVRGDSVLNVAHPCYLFNVYSEWRALLADGGQCEELKLLPPCGEPIYGRGMWQTNLTPAKPSPSYWQARLRRFRFAIEAVPCFGYSLVELGDGVGVRVVNFV